MISKGSKGFTLIELLVVIAIIGILSSVVLASLNTARSKGNDAKVKAQLSGLRAAAEIFRDSDQYGSYGTPANNCTQPGSLFVDTTSGMATYVSLTNYPAGTAMACASTATTYAVKASLSGTGGAYWCVDSVGQSKGYSSGWTTTAVYACP